MAIVEIECTNPIIQCFDLSEASPAQYIFWDKFLDGEDWKRNDIVAMCAEARLYIEDKIFSCYARHC